MAGPAGRVVGRIGGRRRRWTRIGFAVAGVLAIGLAACDNGATDKPAPLVSRAPYSAKPNFVFVLTDDLSLNLIRFMPHVVALEQAGMTFNTVTATDSLCCPSRSSIFTGRFPHNTKVYTNAPPDGGFGIFHSRGEERQTFAYALQQAGYRTGLMGKYLNGYPTEPNKFGYDPDYVPPGWTTWDVGGNAYREFDYRMNENHKIVLYAHAPQDYLTTVIDGKGNDFIKQSVAAKQPFMLEMATFAPHSPFTPAPADAGTFRGLKAPRGPSFGVKPTDAPTWLKQVPPYPANEDQLIDQAYEDRVEAVQSVDRMIAHLENTLRRTGQLRNTYFVFGSDNGFHMGEHGLGRGKLTAFDTDVRIPFIIAGPGIRPGSTNDDVVENIDYAPTFEQLAGVPVPSTVDGHSLVPLLHGQSPPWRTVAGIEHHGPDTDPMDPDAQGVVAGNPPSYDAIRTHDYTYVRYFNGEREYYDLRTDPDEMHNIASRLTKPQLAQLDATLHAIVTCRGATQCWSASRPSTG